MKKLIIVMLAVAIAATTAAPAMAGTKTNKQLVKTYCKEHYKGYKVKLVKSRDLSFQDLTTRKGSKIVIVEVIKSKSRGTYGVTAQGWRLNYNKKVKKGKKVTSYLIYSPHSNAEDDVVAVVDNRRIR